VRLSVTVQRFNSVLIHESFVRTGPLAIRTLDLSFMFIALGIFTTEGEKLIMTFKSYVFADVQTENAYTLISLRYFALQQV